jgi:MFS family permease
LNFYVVFFIFISLSAFRLFFVRMFPDIPPIRSGKLEPLWQNLSKPLTDRNFRRFLVFVLLIWMLYPATKAFMIPYLKLELGFPTSLVVYASSCFALGSILSLIAWGKIADTLGSRFTFLTAGCLLALSYLIVIFVPSYLSTAVPAFCIAAVAFLIQGAGFSGMGIAYSVRMMYEVREEFSGAYITLCRICLGAAGAVGPLISGAILERLPQRIVIFNFSLFSKQPFFLIMSALTLLLFVYLKNLRPIAEQKLGEIIRQLLNSSFSRLNNQLAQIIGVFKNSKTKDRRSLR